MFIYEFVILDKSLHRYFEDVVESDSFKNAFFSVLMKDKKLCDKYLQIYCKRKLTKDLQFMGTYDGKIGRSTGFVSYSHILTLSNGKEYYLTDDGFDLV